MYRGACPRAAARDYGHKLGQSKRLPDVPDVIVFSPVSSRLSSTRLVDETSRETGGRGRAAQFRTGDLGPRERAVGLRSSPACSRSRKSMHGSEHFHLLAQRIEKRLESPVHHVLGLSPGRDDALKSERLRARPFLYSARLPAGPSRRARLPPTRPARTSLIRRCQPGPGHCRPR
jgi:hypothetical protein